MRKQTLAITLTLLLIVGTLGGAAIAIGASWDAVDDLKDTDHLVYLKGDVESGTTDQPSANLTADIDSSPITAGDDSASAEIILVSETNISNVSDDFVTANSSAVTKLTSDTTNGDVEGADRHNWTFNTSIGMYVQLWNLSSGTNGAQGVAPPSHIHFQANNSTIFATSDQGNNTTILTGSTTSDSFNDVIALNITPHGNDSVNDYVGDGTNYSENVTYEVVNELYSLNETYEGSLDDGVDVNHSSNLVEVVDGNDEVTATINHTFNRDENNTAVQIEVVVNKSLARDSEVSFENTDGFQHNVTRGDHEGDQNFNVYVWDVKNSSTSQELDVVLDVSDGEFDGERFNESFFVESEYNALVNGSPGFMSAQYDFQLVQPTAGTAPTAAFLPPFLPGVFGEDIGALVSGLMLVGSIVGTGFVLFQVRKQNILTRNRRIGAYVGLPLAQITVLGVDIIQWALPLYFVLIVGASVMLWRQDMESASTEAYEYV